MKIKVTKEIKEYEGIVKTGVVKPFGTSAHIPFQKKHTGKFLPIILPTNPKYIWLLKSADKKKFINSAKKIIIEEDGKLEHYRLGILEDLSKEGFNINSLIKIIAILERKNKEQSIIKKLRKLYNI